jgi:ketosteroid isomerase-like protein
MLAVAGLAPLGAARAADADEQAVHKANADFYAALNAMFEGQTEPMTAVWSHADDVTYMGPAGGLRVGWSQVLADWQAHAKQKIGGEVQPRDMHVTAGRDLAVTSNLEVGSNIVDGKPVAVTIRATNIFRQEGGHWKMIGHHTDLLPFLTK